jgi:hypothetical protein
MAREVRIVAADLQPGDIVADDTGVKNAGLVETITRGFTGWNGCEVQFADGGERTYDDGEVVVVRIEDGPLGIQAAPGQVRLGFTWAQHYA